MMDSSSRHGKVCVVGSVNIDHVLSLPAFPLPGETVIASDLNLRHGGKGANQAVAAARLGATVSLIGAIGSDAAGQGYRSRLEAEGIFSGFLKEVPDPTGSACIHLLPSGENTIVVCPGANHRLTPADLEAARPLIAEACVLLVQLEVPTETAVAAMRMANQLGTMVIFNPSPFCPTFPWNDVFVDVLILNEGEAEALDRSAPPGEELPAACLIITHGAEAVELITPEGDFTYLPPAVQPVDTVGAGDTFAGAIAARLALGDTIQQAVELANRAAALATLQLGAQEAMPRAADLQ